MTSYLITTMIFLEYITYVYIPKQYNLFLLHSELVSLFVMYSATCFFGFTLVGHTGWYILIEPIIFHCYIICHCLATVPFIYLLFYPQIFGLFFFHLLFKKYYYSAIVKIFICLSMHMYKHFSRIYT